MIKNRDQWNWIKETLLEMEPVKESGRHGLPDRSRLQMARWGGPSPDCGFAGCAIGHLVMFHPEQTLLPKTPGGYQFDLLRFRNVAEYFGISFSDCTYAFSGGINDDFDPLRVVERMEGVEKGGCDD